MSAGGGGGIHGCFSLAWFGPDPKCGVSASRRVCTCACRAGRRIKGQRGCAVWKERRKRACLMSKPVDFFYVN